ncbi:MAG TPA: exodeoxyribonuclease VII large subunit [Phycisphaerae bacterium]|nr:exodeoxyribonuclease VII large subunit [Phycisphaerae bacterium]
MPGKKNPLFDFDPSKARGPRRGPDVGEAAGAGAADLPRPAMSVSLLIARVKAALAGALPEQVTVVGEISNLKRHTSGHIYFRLKDAAASIDAAMFRGAARRMKFEPADGLEVVVEGRIDVYDVRGQLQLHVERMTPKGTGALELAFRQLKEKLQREGLFDPAAKKPIPSCPGAIAVVTSATGAAIRDIRRTLSRRWPAARVYLLPCLVQGEAAAEQIAAAIALLDANAEALGIETIIVGRGGGSLEDLWAFNEEIVARAVYAAGTPIISAVGHEVDVTICDLVADLRAATPTAAAELAVPDRSAVSDLLTTLASRLGRRVLGRLETSRAALEAVRRSVVFRDPTARLRTQTQRLDEWSHRLRAGAAARAARGRRRLERPARLLAAMHPARLHERAAAAVDRLAGRLAWALGGRSKTSGDALTALIERMLSVDPRHGLLLARQKVQAAARQLEAMSYRSVLQRGFSVTRSGAGEILRRAGQVADGEAIETELGDGTFRSRVETGERRAAPADQRTATKRNRERKPPAEGPGLFD